MPRCRMTCPQCKRFKVVGRAPTFKMPCHRCVEGWLVVDVGFVPKANKPSRRLDPRPPKPLLGDVMLLAAWDLMLVDFTVGELIVAAWKRDPARFGLAGQQHPDSHAVMWLLSSKCGPVRKGYLERVRPNVLRLTDAGRARAIELATGGLR